MRCTGRFRVLAWMSFFGHRDTEKGGMRNEKFGNAILDEVPTGVAGFLSP